MLLKSKAPFQSSGSTVWLTPVNGINHTLRGAGVFVDFFSIDCTQAGIGSYFFSLRVETERQVNGVM